jgi:hypothetical protein
MSLSGWISAKKQSLLQNLRVNTESRVAWWSRSSTSLVHSSKSTLSPISVRQLRSSATYTRQESPGVAYGQGKNDTPWGSIGVCAWIVRGWSNTNSTGFSCQDLELTINPIDMLQSYSSVPSEKGEPTVKNYRFLLITGLLILALGSVASQFAQDISSGARKADPGRRSLLFGSSGQLTRRKHRSVLSMAPMGHGGLF